MSYETTYFDVTHRIGDHVVHIYAVHGNGTPNDFKVDEFRPIAALNADINPRAHFATQHTYHLIVTQAHPGNNTVVNGNDAVTGNDRSEERRVGKECRSRWSRAH